jgi:antitoxin (DNA-binding transcriptional repressor) of toxin-antitoxin stability system
MAIIVDVEVAAERLEELMDRACAGEEVSISVDGIPMFWLKPYRNPEEPQTRAA